jgi:hypothetical protein
MRWTLRALALVSLVVYGLALLFDHAASQNNPCPLHFLFKLFLVLVGALGIPPALIGSLVAARRAATRRQWGWLTGLLIASLPCLPWLYGAELDQPPPVVLAPITALSWAVDHALGIPLCGSYSFGYSYAAAVTLPLLAAPLMLLSYSLSSASGTATGLLPSAPE